MLSFPREKVTAKAELLEQDAAITCAGILKKLPIKGKALHDIWSGHIFFVFLDPTTVIESENLSRPDVAPGDLFYYYRPAHYFRGAPYGRMEASEIGVVYDRDSQPRGPRGVRLVNVFGKITENLNGLKRIGEQMITQGAKDLVIERA
jgi:hypothetical protein